MTQGRSKNQVGTGSMWWRSTGRKLRHISSFTFSIDNYDFTPASHDAWGVQRPVVVNTWWNMTFEHWGQKIKSFCFPFYKSFYLPFCCTCWQRRLTCFPSIWKVGSRTGEGSKRATDLKLKEKWWREKKKTKVTRNKTVLMSCTTGNH